MNKFLILYLISQAPALYAADRGAMDPSEARVDALEQMVITGTRTEHSSWDSPIATQTVVIDDDSMQHYKNLAELLASAPGIDMANGIRGQTIRLDGLDAKYTLVLIDGQRVAGKIGDAYDLQNIELAGVQRIEIIRGAGSALYGSDAIGGVINIITRDGVRQRVRTHADTNGQEDVSLSSGVKGEAFSVGVEVFGDRSRPLQINGAEATGFSGSKKIGTQVIPRWKGQDWEVKGRLHASNEDLDATEVSTAGAILKRENALKTYAAGMEPTRFFADGSQLRMSLKEERNLEDYKQHVRRTGSLVTHEKSDERNLESAVSYVRPIEKHTINVGAQHIAEDLTSDRLKQDKVDRERTAAFVQDEYDLLGDGKYILVPALRQDHDTQYDNHTSKKIALRYAPDPSQNFLLSYGEGYRAPSFKELFLLFENTSVGYVVEGNDRLTPESSRSIHAQYSYKTAEGSIWSLAGYHNAIKDMIDNLLLGQDASGTQHYTYQNISAAETLGGDLSLAAALTKAWSLNLGYGFLQARDLSRQTALEGRSKHTISYRLHYVHDAFSVDQQLKWQSSREIGDAADLGNHHAIVSGDLSVSYRQDASWLYSIAIENLGASAGDSYWRIPPRSLSAALTWMP